MPLERPRPIMCLTDQVVFNNTPRKRVVYSAARTDHVPGCDVLTLQVSTACWRNCAESRWDGCGECSLLALDMTGVAGVESMI